MTLIKLSGLTVSAIAASNREPEQYAVYGENRLYLADSKTQTACEVAALPNIQKIAHDLGDGRLEGKELEIALCFHHPYVCVTERFGVNGALVNLSTGAVRELRREDYHCDVSSYSAGFAELDGRALFICQTQWNRLDIFDVETGKNLTEREVYTREIGQKEADESPVYERKNYLDYFHSQLLISPDSRHFLSNGWVWSPFDQIYLFDTAEFFRTHELGRVHAVCGSGYNWDRPCAFIDGDLFVAVVDDDRKTGNLDEDELVGYEYRQLTFFSVSAKAQENDHGYRWIDCVRNAASDVFTPNKYGEVKGRLYYDPVAGYLVALTLDRGAFAVSLNGEILANLPDMLTADVSDHGDLGSRYRARIGWDYSPEHHVFYGWQEGTGIAERRFGQTG
jgi:hypothetical protein